MAAMSDEFREAIADKDRLESKIEALQDYLNQPGMPGVSESLIDSEGFPRADIDIYAVRKARNELACAQTDHKAAMKDIEQRLYALHAESRVDVPRRPPAAPAMDGVEANRSALSEPAADSRPVASFEVKIPQPFALIDDVAEGGPAQESGLRVGDYVCSFGGISRAESDLAACFAQVQQLVPQSAGTSIELVVLRGAEHVTLSLVPKTWSGRGLLGCHLKPQQ